MSKKVAAGGQPLLRSPGRLNARIRSTGRGLRTWVELDSCLGRVGSTIYGGKTVIFSDI